MSDELKQKGNDFFVKGEMEEAARLYTEAIDTYGATAVLLTNRAAARIELMQFVQAREDATAAIALNSKFVKAYYRKATVEQKLGMEKASFETWQACMKTCESSTWLKQNYAKAEHRWVAHFRRVPINDDKDFLERYSLLPTSRERLSTMAHLWNESTKKERLAHFHYFLQLVGGTQEIAERYRDMKPEQMPDMPMHNYADLTLDLIPSWCAFFKSLSGTHKTAVLKQMYNSLTSAEQTLVIQDLGLFINMATHSSGAVHGGGQAIANTPAAGGAGAPSGDASGNSENTTGSESVDENIARFVRKEEDEEALQAEVARSMDNWKKQFG